LAAPLLDVDFGRTALHQVRRQVRGAGDGGSEVIRAVSGRGAARSGRVGVAALAIDRLGCADEPSSGDAGACRPVQRDGLASDRRHRRRR
jgi:hypothetical protein